MILEVANQFDFRDLLLRHFLSIQVEDMGKRFLHENGLSYGIRKQDFAFLLIDKRPQVVFFVDSAVY